METFKLDVQQIFAEDVHYTAPLFQRPYVWNERDQWLPLWDDIHPLADGLASGRDVRFHFMGASIREAKDVPPGTTRTFQIIDGQQRLTTLQILLKAFGDVAGRKGFIPHRSKISRYIVNDTSILVSEENKLKVWPTHSDRKPYKMVMDAEYEDDWIGHLYSANENPTVPVGNIVGAYTFFFRRINQWLSDDKKQTEKRLQGLLGALLNRLTMVVIDIDSHDDAQAIFESLNARGTTLLSADLIKNYLLQKVDSDKVEHYHSKYWKFFDDDIDFWRKNVGSGHAQRPQIETFFFYALSLINGNFVSTRFLYDEFRAIEPQLEDGDPVKCLKRLHNLGKIFRDLKSKQSDERISDFFYRLSIIDVVSAWPLILALFEKFPNNVPMIKHILIDIESYLVRRMICGYTTRNYRMFFSKLIGLVNNNNEKVCDLVREKLLNCDSRVDRFPTDKEFESAWINTEISGRLTTKRVRMLLEAMEQELHTKYTERVTLPQNLSIEHIMPKKWQKHWFAEDIDKEFRDKVINTVGNLTLVKQKFNAAQSNRGWLSTEKANAGKRDQLKEHSVLMMNKQITKEENWTEAEILSRSKALFNNARKLWFRPKL